MRSRRTLTAPTRRPSRTTVATVVALTAATVYVGSLHDPSEVRAQVSSPSGQTSERAARLP